MRLRYIYIVYALMLFTGCKEKKVEKTPWGTVIGEDSTEYSEEFSLSDIINNGEMIMLTLSGPDSYYDYHSHGMGLQYLLCEKFAQKIGVSLRVEVCKDTTDMINRLRRGEGDLIVYNMKGEPKDLKAIGIHTDSASTGWLVKNGSKELADSMRTWFKPEMVAQLKKQESFLLSTASIRRHVYSPMLDRAGGIISRYDGYFKLYSRVARMDWRLMAAQCYQESCFDPQARSWAGACGLMQIMPSTADHLGLPRSEMFKPEANIAASARYMAELTNNFRDVPTPIERTKFALASYNGGARHIRDAMALAHKYGRNPHRWSDVAYYVLRLQSPQFYGDPVVKYGYMRGSETVDYVNRIISRWNGYRGVPGGSIHINPDLDDYGQGSPNLGKEDFAPIAPMAPKRSKHRNKYSV